MKRLLLLSAVCLALAWAPAVLAQSMMTAMSLSSAMSSASATATASLTATALPGTSGPALLPIASAILIPAIGAALFVLRKR